MKRLLMKQYIFKQFYDSQLWLNHCLATKGVVSSVHSIFIKYNIPWSDHYPLLTECNVYVIVPKIYYDKSTANEVMWGERGIQQTECFYKECHTLLNKLDMPHKFAKVIRCLIQCNTT